MTGSVGVDDLHGSGHSVKYLKAKPRIGSCKNPINYEPAQIVFHRDDIPESRKVRKMEVREWASSKILSTDRAAWSKMTKAELYPVCERRQAENFKGDRSKPYTYNFRAESLELLRTAPPIDRPGKFTISRQLESEVLALTALQQRDPVQRGQFKRTEELPSHPKLADALEWNNRTASLAPAEMQYCLDRLTLKSRAATARINTELGLTREYVSPINQVRVINSTVREQKKSGTFTTKEMLTTGTHREHEQEVPLAAYRRSLRNRHANEPSRKYSTYQHSGVWEFNAAEGRHMWSDTGSFVYESRGDIKHTSDPDRYNLEGPTQPSLPRPRLILSRMARTADSTAEGH